MSTLFDAVGDICRTQYNLGAKPDPNYRDEGDYFPEETLAKPIDVPRIVSKLAREASGLRHGEYEVKNHETFECLGLEWIYEERPSRDSGCRVTIMAVNVYNAQERHVATLPAYVLTDDYINAMEAEIAAKQDAQP